MSAQNPLLQAFDLPLDRSQPFGGVIVLENVQLGQIIAGSGFGDQVNLESDLIGKYVERLLQERGQLPAKPTHAIDKDYLQKRGLL